MPLVTVQLEPLPFAVDPKVTYHVQIHGDGSLKVSATTSRGGQKVVATCGTRHDFTAHRGAVYDVDDAAEAAAAAKSRLRAVVDLDTGDVDVRTPPAVAKKAPAKKAPVKKAPVKKAPVKKAPMKAKAKVAAKRKKAKAR